jgi:NAD-dependent SIR2 family protein deacetylase
MNAWLIVAGATLALTGEVHGRMAASVRCCGCQSPKATDYAIDALADNEWVVPVCLNCKRPMYFDPPRARK